MATNNGNNEPRKVKRHLDSLRAKARTHVVTMQNQNTYDVVSGGSGEKYTVSLNDKQEMFCNCQYAIKRGTDLETGEVFSVACSHTIAVFEFIALGNRRLVTLHEDVERARKQHRPTVDTGDGVVLVSRRAHYKQADFLDMVEEQ